jgi:ABC-type glycerol-3-phosphate transport system permease component
MKCEDNIKLKDNPRRKIRQDRGWVYLFLFPASLMVVGIQLVPLLYSLYLSFQNWVLLQSSSPQGFVGLENYKFALQDPSFTRTIQFTLFLTFTTVPMQILIGTGLAYLVVGNSRFLHASRALLVLPMVVAPIAIGTLWRLLYNDSAGPINNHLLNLVGIVGPNWLGDSFWAKIAIVIIEIWQWTPFVFIVISAALTTIPQDIMQAAEVDGASRFQLFRYIELPLLAPAFLLVLMFRTLESLLTLDSVLSLTRGGPGTSTLNVTYYIYAKALREFDLGEASADSWMFMAVASVLIFTIFRLTVRSEQRQ